MATELEDLRILKTAEAIADAIWKEVAAWDEFAQDVVGKQLARAIDSIGSNIAASYGRLNDGEKLQFLYYARGSLFETKYWLNRTLVRELMQAREVKEYAVRLSEVARQLNTFANSLKTQPKDKAQPETIHESPSQYRVDDSTSSNPLFSDTELNWLES